jgi:hypothetical protein
MLKPKALQFMRFFCRGSSVSIATMLRAGRPGFDSRQGLRIFILATASRPALVANPASYSIVTGGSLARIKPAGGVKLTTYLHLVPRLMRGAIPPFPNTFSLRGASLSNG